MIRHITCISLLTWHAPLELPSVAVEFLPSSLLVPPHYLLIVCFVRVEHRLFQALICHLSLYDDLNCIMIFLSLTTMDLLSLWISTLRNLLLLCQASVYVVAEGHFWKIEFVLYHQIRDLDICRAWIWIFLMLHIMFYSNTQFLHVCLFVTRA